MLRSKPRPATTHRAVTESPWNPGGSLSRERDAEFSHQQKFQFFERNYLL
jgi:hypothetical protein